MFKKKQRSETVVGLDLDPSHIAAAEVHVNGSVTVKKGAIVALRPGVLRDGEASDPVALAEALRELFSENDLPRRVRLGIANQRIVVRSIDLPVIEDPKGLAAAVHAEAPDHIPMPMDEAVVDFQSLGVVNTPMGPRSRRPPPASRRSSTSTSPGSRTSRSPTARGACSLVRPPAGSTPPCTPCPSAAASRRSTPASGCSTWAC